MSRYHVGLRLSISLWVPEIFAVKVESFLIAPKFGRFLPFKTFKEAVHYVDKRFTGFEAHEMGDGGGH